MITFLNADLFKEKVEKMSIRQGFGEGLIIAGEQNPNVVVLSADLAESTKASLFKDKFPDRYFEVGVAEQNLVTVASGMAAAGKIPFACSYAVFSPGRCWEQIRTTICYNDVPVIIVGSHAGITVGPDGATHQALEDIAIMRSLPNMVVLSPCDAVEARKATIAAVALNKPCYIRLFRNDSPLITSEEAPFDIGKAQVLWEGKDVTIIATGQMVYWAIMAAKELNENNISVRVINSSTIKPLDKNTILKAAEETSALVTVEDHQINGGLGSAVAELISREFPVPVQIIGIEDRFGESGEAEELMEKYGLSKSCIIKGVTRALRMKGG